MFERAWSTFRPDPTNQGGQVSDVLQAVTQESYTFKNINDPNLTDQELVDMLRKFSSEMVAVSTIDMAETSYKTDLGGGRVIYGPHAYVVRYFDESLANNDPNKIWLYNPWRDVHVKISFSELRSFVANIHYKDN